jgi:hypothetical protein
MRRDERPPNAPRLAVFFSEEHFVGCQLKPQQTRG